MGDCTDRRDPDGVQRNVLQPDVTLWLDATAARDDLLVRTTAAFDGPRKHNPSRGFVVAGRRQRDWGSSTTGPFRADYRIAYLAADYSQVVVAREKRDYVLDHGAHADDRRRRPRPADRLRRCARLRPEPASAHAASGGR
jgi:hypothetical protein